MKECIWEFEWPWFLLYLIDLTEVRNGLRKGALWPHSF